MFLLIICIFTSSLFISGISWHFKQREVTIFPCKSGHNTVITVGSTLKKSNSSGIVKVLNFKPNTRCTVALTPAESKNGIFLQFYKTELRPNCIDKVKFIKKNNASDTVCENTFAQWFAEHETVTVEVEIGPGKIDSSNQFQMIFTSYRDFPCIFMKEFGCYIDICISTYAVCDNYPQCTYGEDEEFCGGQPLRVVTYTFLSVAIIFLVTFLVLYVFHHKRTSEPSAVITINRTGHPGPVYYTTASPAQYPPAQYPPAQYSPAYYAYPPPCGPPQYAYPPTTNLPPYPYDIPENAPPPSQPAPTTTGAPPNQPTSTNVKETPSRPPAPTGETVVYNENYRAN